VVDRFVDAAGHFGHRGTPAQCLPVAAGVAEVVGEFGVGDEFGSAGRVAEFDEGSGACRHTVRGSTTPKKLPTTWAVGGAARLAAHFLAAGPACADEARRYSVAARPGVDRRVSATTTPRSTTRTPCGSDRTAPRTSSCCSPSLRSHGTGPEAAGPLVALVLAMTGRRPATEDLTGDGVAVLRDRA
jgi:hypothetical protein